MPARVGLAFQRADEEHIQMSIVGSSNLSEVRYLLRDVKRLLEQVLEELQHQRHADHEGEEETDPAA